MSAPDVKAVRERAEKATPGPWGITRWPGAEPYGFDICTGEGSPTALNVTVGDDGGGAFFNDDDAIFCAHSREDVPALCDRVEELELELETEVVRTGGLRELMGELEAENAALRAAGRAMLDAFPFSSHGAIKQMLDALDTCAASQGETGG